MITQEAQFVVGDFPISGQFLVIRDVVRALRQQMPGPEPIRWDITVISLHYGLLRVIAYRL